MAITTRVVSSKDGLVALPDEIIKEYGLLRRDQVVVRREGKRIIIEPAEELYSEMVQLCEELFGDPEGVWEEIHRMRHEDDPLWRLDAKV